MIVANSWQYKWVYAIFLRINALLKRWFVSVFVGLLLVSCSDESIDTPVTMADSDQAYLKVTFADGPNQGTHVYYASDEPVSNLSLQYHQLNNATFLTAFRLETQDSRFRIDELQRFVQGELNKGANQVSDWRGEALQAKADGSKACGEVKLRDRDESLPYANAFGVFLDCKILTVSSFGKWRDIPVVASNQSKKSQAKQIRMVRGEFEDRVRLRVTNDNDPFQRVESTILVEFYVPQKRNIVPAS